MDIREVLNVVTTSNPLSRGAQTEMFPLSYKLTSDLARGCSWKFCSHKRLDSGLSHNLFVSSPPLVATLPCLVIGCPPSKVAAAEMSCEW